MMENQLHKMLYSLGSGQYTKPIRKLYCGRLAQLVEQVTFNHWVTGSNPVPLTMLRASELLGDVTCEGK